MSVEERLTQLEAMIRDGSLVPPDSLGDFVEMRRLIDSNIDLIQELLSNRGQVATAIDDLQEKAEKLERQSRSHNLRFGNLPYPLTNRTIGKDQAIEQSTAQEDFLMNLSENRAKAIFSRIDNFHPCGRGIIIVALNRLDRKYLLRNRGLLRDYRFRDRKIFVSEDKTAKEQAHDKVCIEYITRASTVWPESTIYLLGRGVIYSDGRKLSLEELKAEMASDSVERLKRLGKAKGKNKRAVSNSPNSVVNVPKKQRRTRKHDTTS